MVFKSSNWKFARFHHSNNHIFTFQLNSSKEEVKAVQEKMEKQKEENEKKLEDEKKLTETNSKSHQTELQSKLDVSQKPLNGKKNCNVENQGLLVSWLNLVNGKNFQIIADLKKQIADLESKTIAELPPDAQQTIQSYKDR